MRTDFAGGVLRLTLDRPERLNAVDLDMLNAMSGAIEAAGRDVRVIVLTGEGRAFCSGADMSALEGPPEALMDAANRLIRGIVTSPVPVITAVNGPAAGFGVGLACAADLTYAAESAYFFLSFIDVGLMPDGGATHLVPTVIGRSRAAEMALLGDRLPAAEARERGLVARVLPDEQLADHVSQIAARLAAGPRHAQELTKRALAATMLERLDAALDREKQGQVGLLGSADCAEGIAAFRERRRPRFEP